MKDQTRSPAPRPLGMKIRRDFLIGLIGLILAGSAYSCRSSDEPSGVFPGASHRAAAVPQDERTEPDGDADPIEEKILPNRVFAQIARLVSPAVVYLKTVQRAGRLPRFLGPYPGLGFFDDLFQWFRGPSISPSIRQEGVGSGFLIHPAGYLLTNHHVVDRADAIRAVLSDGREYPGRVVGRDAGLDLALVRIEGDRIFPTIAMGDSDRLEPGEWALAVGSPFGLAQTFTVGVISATGRGGLGYGSRARFIQTDASINYGNSGGPLLNIDGEAIGINTAVMPFGHGIGFAIPINTARTFTDPIMRRQWVRRPWLGITVAGSEETEDGAIVVKSVRWGSPAFESGIRSGDQIVGWDGKEMTGAWELLGAVRRDEIGRDRTLTLIRRGERREIPIRTGEGLERIFP